MKLLILLEEDEQHDWHHFSAKNLSDAYSDTEPSYTLDMIKERNEEYNK